MLRRGKWRIYELKLCIECVVTQSRFVVCAAVGSGGSASRVTVTNQQTAYGLGVEEYSQGGISNIQAVYLFKFHTEHMLVACGRWTGGPAQRLGLRGE